MDENAELIDDMNAEAKPSRAEPDREASEDVSASPQKRKISPIITEATVCAR